MRLGAVVLAVLAVIGVAACGRDAGAPLPLEQRVLNEADAPGSQPDPVERPRTAVGLDELATIMEHQLITATEEDAVRIGEDGFISAILDTRFFPIEPDGGHSGGLPHIVTLVAMFDSGAGANDAVDLLHTDGLEPCPETCAFDIAEFDVDGIPNAHGIQRIATQERLDQIGDERPAHAEYLILFADGPFAYSVKLFGPPDDVSEQQAQEIARRLYDRVQGLPPPQG
jgi:hypothetical protein